MNAAGYPDWGLCTAPYLKNKQTNKAYGDQTNGGCRISNISVMRIGCYGVESAERKDKQPTNELTHTGHHAHK